MMPPSIRLELYEHETLRVGQVRRGVDGGSIKITARHVNDLVRFNDQHGRRFFSAGHDAVTMTSQVGYLEVGDVAIEILPKVDRASGRGERGWRVGILEMLRVALGLRLATADAASQRVGRSSLIELIATRFVEEVERLLHEGLARGYRRVQENGPAFRGRLLVSENLRENLVRSDRFYVEHHTFDPDVLVNRILALGLAVLDGLALSSSLSSRARACSSLFPEVTELPSVTRMPSCSRGCSSSTAHPSSGAAMPRSLPSCST
jgi:5-methylcytosine-specific restriction enzyme subunit McrC